MISLALLIPVALCMGAIGLVAFFWSLRNGQYDDLTGDAERILFSEDKPLLDADTHQAQQPNKERQS